MSNTTLLPFTITSYNDASKLFDFMYYLRYTISNSTIDTQTEILDPIKTANFGEIENEITKEWESELVNSYNLCSKIEREFVCNVIENYMNKYCTLLIFYFYMLFGYSFFFSTKKTKKCPISVMKFHLIIIKYMQIHHLQKMNN